MYYEDQYTLPDKELSCGLTTQSPIISNKKVCKFIFWYLYFLYFKSNKLANWGRNSSLNYLGLTEIQLFISHTSYYLFCTGCRILYGNYYLFPWLVDSLSVLLVFLLNFTGQTSSSLEKVQMRKAFLHYVKLTLAISSLLMLLRSVHRYFTNSLLSSTLIQGKLLYQMTNL